MVSSFDFIFPHFEISLSKILKNWTEASLCCLLQIICIHFYEEFSLDLQSTEEIVPLKGVYSHICQSTVTRTLFLERHVAVELLKSNFSLLWAPVLADQVIPQSKNTQLQEKVSLWCQESDKKNLWLKYDLSHVFQPRDRQSVNSRQTITVTGSDRHAE